jgi:hypothetical protein
MELYGLTSDQAERIIESVVHARDGFITKGEMADRIEEVIGGDPFETDIA